MLIRIVLLMSVALPLWAEIPVDCVYPHKDTYEMTPVKDCGLLDEKDALSLKAELLEKVDWSKYGLTCLYVTQPKAKAGWYYLSQQNLGRISPFGQDNDCVYFSEGLAVGLSQGKIIYYDQSLSIQKETHYTWASHFYQGFSKVCLGKLKRVGQELFTYQGGRCGFINRSFEVVVPVIHPFEETPEPL